MFFNKKSKQEQDKLPSASGVVFALSRKTAWLLWLCQCLNIAVIGLELNTWMLAVISLSLAWQALLLEQGKASGSAIAKLIPKLIPNRSPKQAAKLTPKQSSNRNQSQVKSAKVSPVLLGGFALLGCLAIVITAKESGVLISMLQLLCFSYVLKAFELRKRSDFYQLLLLGLFVLAAALIFRQDLAFTLIILALLILNLAVLLQFFSGEKSFAVNIKVVVILLGQSTLLAIVLFLVFPRLSPFWQVPLAKSAETGLSDTVKPGDIANLTRSTKLAFRAEFKEEIPAYSQLYWRAMVLEDYDGRQWSRQKPSSHNQLGKADKQSLGFDARNTDVSPIAYRITTEASFQRYLFALAPAVADSAVNTNVIALADYTFQSASIISQTKSYQLSSYLSAPLAQQISKQSKSINLSYPKGSNPRLEQLALELRHNYLEPKVRAQAVLELINQQNYAYTLQPPLLKNNSLDQFFFDTQAGFCVHYASAFTFLMRASGIPARLVTGYLGGEYNDINSEAKSGSKGHLSIYQYDAHAWSEIWLAGEGWLRIDPTSAVDPERVNSGWSNQLLQQQSALNNDLFSLYRMKNIVWLNALRLQFDALDYQWTRLVIGFTSKQQVDLLKSWFGNMRPWKLALIIAVALIASMVMLLLVLQLVNRDKPKKNAKTPWQVIYLTALAKLAKQGIVKPAAMTVNDFAKQVRELSPELAIAFTRLSVTYNRLSYQTVSLDRQAKLIVTMGQQYQQFIHKLKNKG